MEFNSIDFMVFFPVVLALYFVIPKVMRQFWLLVASYFFYISWNVRYAVLIAGSTLITYLSGIIIDRNQGGGKREEDSTYSLRWNQFRSLVLI